MNGAVVDEMLALDPDVVVVKGDLTDTGTAEEYEAFLDALRRARRRACTTCAATTTRCATRRWRVEGAPYAIELDGVTLAVLDTVVPGSRSAARSTAEQLGVARRPRGRRDRGPVLVFGTTPCGTSTPTTALDPHYAITRDDCSALCS